MGGECDENLKVDSAPQGLKYSAGHNHNEDLGSMVLVGVVGISNASSPGRLSLAKATFDHDLPATLTSPQRPWRYHDKSFRQVVGQIEGCTQRLGRSAGDTRPAVLAEGRRPDLFLRSTMYGTQEV